MRNDLFWVRVSDTLLETLMLAAIEAYCLGDGRPQRTNGLETMGLIWGTTRDVSERSEGRRFILVDRAVASLSADRDTGSVGLHSDAPKLMNDLVLRWSPQLNLLGHFHTHPYDDLAEVRGVQGHRLSPEDVEYFLYGPDADLYWEQAGGHPIMLVMTIAKMKRVSERHEGEKIDWNCFSFDVGNFRFWLRAVGGFIANDGSRQITANVCGLNEDEPQVFLDLDTKFFNSRGDKVFG